MKSSTNSASYSPIFQYSSDMAQLPHLQTYYSHWASAHSNSSAATSACFTYYCTHWITQSLRYGQSRSASSRAWISTFQFFDVWASTLTICSSSHQAADLNRSYPQNRRLWEVLSSSRGMICRRFCRTKDAPGFISRRESNLDQWIYTKSLFRIFAEQSSKQWFALWSQLDIFRKLKILRKHSLVDLVCIATIKRRQADK